MDCSEKHIKLERENKSRSKKRKTNAAFSSKSANILAVKHLQDD